MGLQYPRDPDDNQERGSQYDGVKIIGTIDDLEYILEQNSLDEIAITLSLGEYEKLRRDRGLM